MKLEEAKRRIRVPELWRHFGFPGDPAPSCRCPWREDRKPSFSVHESGELWNDFSTGEGGDAVDFLRHASGLSAGDACRKFIELAGGRIQPIARAPRVIQQPTERARPSLGGFREGTPEELQALASLRGIGLEGIRWASARGVLRFGTVKGHPAWIVMDGEKVNAQARRLDGKPWEDLNAKARTARGAWAAWPLGIREAEPFPCIALVEGGPDFLAAHYLSLWEQASHYSKQDVHCAPVTMLGASLRIHADALPLFAGKRVRLFGHGDPAGREAVTRWARELEPHASEVDAFDFGGLVRADGTPAKDLNDCLNLNPDSFSETKKLLPI